MRFRRRKKQDDPEINLVAMIDVLLVLIIFLMLTTTYTKFSGAKIDLPTAESSVPPAKPESVEIGISISGRLFVNTEALPDSRIETVAGRPRPLTSHKDLLMSLSFFSSTEKALR